MKKTFLLTALLFCASGAFTQSYNVNLGGIQFSSGAAVPGSCPRDGGFFFKNTTTKNWYMCIAGSYVGIGTSVGTVTGGPFTSGNVITGNGSQAIQDSGTALTVLAHNGVDINASNQVTATHLAAALPINQGGTAQTQAGQYGVMLSRLASAVTETGTITETIAYTGAIPAGLLTTTSRVVIRLGGKVTTGVGAISLTVRFGASGSGLGGTAVVPTISLGASGAINFGGDLTIVNNNSLSSQNSWGDLRVGSAEINHVNTPAAINTANASEVNITFTVPTANDAIALYDACIIVYP